MESINRRLRSFLPNFLLLAALAGPLALQAQDGIYADFTTTKGNFSCRLDYTNAPKAVANFIGLATGQRPWLDLATGRAKTNAFYNGLLFHRVVAGFMIQGGSPNGLGTDGPGYLFPDRFSPLLRHSTNGILSMANSGPDSNGSQFFITVAPTPWLDDVHTVFGRVVTGQNVVDAISQVATNASSKPLTNVVIQSVAIRRVGTAAQAFNINAQNLPGVSNQVLRISRLVSQVGLNFTNRQFADNRLYASTNLATWTSNLFGIDYSAAPTNRFVRNATAAREFFRLAQVQYASFAPSNVLNRTFVLTVNGGGITGGILTLALNGSGGGTYTFPGVTGGTQAVTGYTWYREPFGGSLWPIYFSGLATMTLRFDFDSPTAGTYVGTVYSGGGFTISGPFTITP